MRTASRSRFEWKRFSIVHMSAKRSKEYTYLGIKVWMHGLDPKEAYILDIADPFYTERDFNRKRGFDMDR